MRASSLIEASLTEAHDETLEVLTHYVQNMRDHGLQFNSPQMHDHAVESHVDVDLGWKGRDRIVVTTAHVQGRTMITLMLGSTGFGGSVNVCNNVVESAAEVRSVAEKHARVLTALASRPTP